MRFWIFIFALVLVSADQVEDEYRKAGEAYRVATDEYRLAGDAYTRAADHRRAHHWNRNRTEDAMMDTEWNAAVAANNDASRRYSVGIDAFRCATARYMYAHNITPPSTTETLTEIGRGFGIGVAIGIAILLVCIVPLAPRVYKRIHLPKLLRTRYIIKTKCGDMLLEPIPDDPEDKRTEPLLLHESV